MAYNRKTRLCSQYNVIGKTYLVLVLLSIGTISVRGLNMRSFQQGLNTYYSLQQLGAIATFYQQPLTKLQNIPSQALDPVVTGDQYGAGYMNTCSNVAFESVPGSLLANWIWASPVMYNSKQDISKWIYKKPGIYNFLVMASLAEPENAHEYIRVKNAIYTAQVVNILQKLEGNCLRYLQHINPAGYCPPFFYSAGLTYWNFAAFPGNAFELYGFSQWQVRLNSSQLKYVMAMQQLQTYMPPILQQLEAYILGIAMCNATANGVIDKVSPTLPKVSQQTASVARLYANHTEKILARGPIGMSADTCELGIQQIEKTINDLSLICQISVLAGGGASAGAAIGKAGVLTAGAVLDILTTFTGTILTASGAIIPAKDVSAQLAAFAINTIFTAIILAGAYATSLATGPLAFALAGIGLACSLLGALQHPIANAVAACAGICSTNPTCQLTSAGCIQAGF